MSEEKFEVRWQIGTNKCFLLMTVQQCHTYELKNICFNKCFRGNRIPSWSRGGKPAALMAWTSAWRVRDSDSPQNTWERKPLGKPRSCSSFLGPQADAGPIAGPRTSMRGLADLDTLRNCLGTRKHEKQSSLPTGPPRGGRLSSPRELQNPSPPPVLT